MKQMTLVAALKDYFGYRPNTGAAEFLQEIKALTAQDKLDFKAMFPSVGYEIVERA